MGPKISRQRAIDLLVDNKRSGGDHERAQILNGGADTPMWRIRKKGNTGTGQPVI